MLKKDIQNLTNFILVIVNIKIILKQFLELFDLIKALNFYIYKLLYIVIIYINKNLIFAIF